MRKQGHTLLSQLRRRGNMKEKKPNTECTSGDQDEKKDITIAKDLPRVKKVIIDVENGVVTFRVEPSGIPIKDIETAIRGHGYTIKWTENQDSPETES
jgi:hypothetical protein